MNAQSLSGDRTMPFWLLFGPGGPVTVRLGELQ